MSTEIPSIASKHTLGIIFSYFFGALFSSFLIPRASLQLNKGYLIGFALQGILLASIVSLPLASGNFAASFACGLQNALSTGYSGAHIRTTHMTGVVTDLAVELGHLFRWKSVNWGKCRLLSGLLISFLSGGIIAHTCFTLFGIQAFYLPSAVLFLLTFIGIRYYKFHSKSLNLNSNPTIST